MSEAEYNTSQFANIVSAVRDAKHPKEIGPYVVQDVIGEGGMGTVYRAFQREPFNRIVAIKIIKLGMDTREVMARFEAERRALALMNHTNVAKVLDAGATDAGRPYFVMEYVKGESITNYADKHKLTVRQRVELFLQACEAVQHAHHKAIIHRDIKPTNILVTEEGGKPLVKVIDFGVAKALSNPLTEQTLFTATGQLVGTPEYMAPEQAESNAPDVDTRTDVYSLGVVLYELLSGSLPFDAGTLRSAGYNEIQRIIREVDPPRPSTRLSKLGASAEEIARRRSVELDALARQLRSDLEWIPLKAMRKERAQRYASPTELAEDLRNYLNDRPLRAAPESAAYRAKKFLRRNKASVVAATAMLVLLIAGIIATSWQAIRANREKREAQFQRQQALIASENLREVNHFLTEDLLASASPEVTRGRDLTVREAVDRAADTVSQRFRGRPSTEAAIRMILADTYNSLGMDSPALDHAQSAYDLLTTSEGADSTKAIEAGRILGRQLQMVNRAPEAETLLRDVLARAERVLGSTDEVTLSTVIDLGNALRRQRRFADAEPFFRRVVEADRAKYGPNSDEIASSLNTLAVLLSEDTRDDEAEPLYYQSLAIRKRYGPDSPSYLITYSNLARLVGRRGRLAESESMTREILAQRRRVLKDDHPSTLSAMNDLANILVLQWKFDEAEALHRDALARHLRLNGPEDIDTLQIMNNLGKVLSHQGKLDEAEQLLRQALTTRQRILGPAHPHTLSSMAGLARTLMRARKWDEADRVLNELMQPEYFKELSGAAQAGVLAAHGERLLERGDLVAAERELLDARTRMTVEPAATGRREMLQALIRVCEQSNRPADAKKYRAELQAVPTSQP